MAEPGVGVTVTGDPGTELRPMREGDATMVAAINEAGSVDSALRWVRSLLADQEAGREVACAVCVGGERVGYVLLEVHDHREGLLHYGLVPSHRGRGIATRACTAMVVHAFSTLGLEALKVDPYADNAPSCRVAERVGFTRVGTILSEEGGRRREIARYRLTAEQWRGLGGPDNARRGPS
ncbi:MAG: GNAT family protein [Candidatus Latescibacterota bacterium]